MNKLYVMLPCYNEERDIEKLVNKWVDLISSISEKGFELSVNCVNDCSTDSTDEVLLSLKEKYPETVNVIEHEVNKGLGGVLLTSFKHFLSVGEENDICLLMDGDDTHDPIYCLDMLDKIKNNEADCVIASRYCGNSKTFGVSGIRLFMSWGAKQYYSMVLGVKNVKDYTCGYRAYSYDIIKKAYETFGDDLVERRSFACMMEVLYKLHTVGARFDEVPFELRYDNKEGESKMKIIKTVKESLLTAAQLRRKYK